MKIRRGQDGKVWLFNESAYGWIEFESVIDADAGEILKQLIRDEMSKHSNLSRCEAHSEIYKKYPEITKRYIEQFRRKN